MDKLREEITKMFSLLLGLTIFIYDSHRNSEMNVIFVL